MYKKLFALSITSTLSISSLIGTGIVLLNQNNNNKNLVTHYNYNKSSKKSQSIEKAEKQGIKIRTNPINGFDSLDVSNGNKLVLTTVEKPDELKTYGVALVNFVSNEMLSHWEIPTVNSEFLKQNKITNKKYVENYTTNIIPGNDANEFFVLAGISNLADALNTVYTEYNEDAITFEEVVGADKVKLNLEDAPCIRIFKIKIENNELIGAENDVNKNWWYNFEYPDFKSTDKKADISRNEEPDLWHSNETSKGNNEYGGLKYFTSSGIFTSNLIYPTGSSGSRSYLSAGYFQYLQYGQLFQYDYKHTTKNLGNDEGKKHRDAFVLMSSYISSDPQMGNLYSLYSKKDSSYVPAIGMVDYLFDEVLKPNIKDNNDLDKNYGNGNPYLQFDKNVTKKAYQKNTGDLDKVKYDVGPNDTKAEDNDQLNIDTVLALAFMLDYSGSIYFNNGQRKLPAFLAYENDLQNDIRRSLFRIGHSSYNFYPGYFLFKPNGDTPNDYVTYCYIWVRGQYSSGSDDSWYTTIGAYYNKDATDFDNNTKGVYFLVLADLRDNKSKFPQRYWFTKYDLFNTNERADYSRDNGTRYPLQNDEYIKGIYNKHGFSFDSQSNGEPNKYKPMFIKVLDFKQNLVIFSNGTNTLGLLKWKNNNVFDAEDRGRSLFLQNDQDLIKSDLVKFDYNSHTNVISVITNNKIHCYILNDNHIPKPGDNLILVPDDDIKRHELGNTFNIFDSIKTIDVTQDNGQDLDNSRSYIKAFQLTINNGFANSKDTDNIKDLTNHFMIQTATSNNGSEIIGINTPAELGYFETCTIDELDDTIKQKSTDDLMLATMKELKDFFVKNEYKKGTMREIVGSGIKIVNDSEIINGTEIFRLSSVIRKSGKYMIGFTLLDDGQIKDIVSGNAKYNVNDFSQEKRYVVFKQDIMNSQIPYKNKSVAEIKAMFKKNNKDIENFKRSIINLIIDETESNLGDYKLEDFSIIIDDENTSESSNTIAFFVIHSESGKIMKVQDINNDYVKKSFRFNDIFAKKLSSTTITWIAVGTTLGVLAFIGLGVGIGIPLRKNSQKIDTLTTAIAKVFSKMNDINIRKRTPVLLQNKKPSGYLAANRPKAITTSKSNVGPQRFVSLKTYSTANSAKTANVGPQRFVPLKTVRNHPDNRNKPTVSDWPKRGL